MKTSFLNYLRFNRSERNGTLGLFLIAALLFGIPEISRRFLTTQQTDFEPFQQEVKAFRAALEAPQNASARKANAPFNFDPNTVSEEALVRLGLSEKIARNICHYREKGGKFRQASDFQKIWGLPEETFQKLLPFVQIGGSEKPNSQPELEKPEAELFAFDPNLASESEFKRLGLPDRAVKSILHYREKGGQFRKKEDLEKIYTLEAEDYARIAAYAQFPETMTGTAKPRPTSYADGDRFPAKKTAAPIDINEASLESWRTLPGIGEMRARQLVNYREKLGGFLSVDQVGEMIGFPDSVFQAIKPFLVLETPELRKINLNTASIAELDAHPYISKRQAELIVAYREQHGAYASPEDIGKMRAISDKGWMAKVRPYLGI